MKEISNELCRITWVRGLSANLIGSYIGAMLEQQLELGYHPFNFITT